ncbi:hypothetical protein HK099_004150 [Clydaea vesicula]|uniref:Methyltransferase FkbM domain-containing protein n=1 Tax=Clydaea vesicula TaxID=447962 RepID=A0AAD5Y0F5_9FUNG|nr:hypothetical protein HK099_004150 [Clydaea vesicula]
MNISNFQVSSSKSTEYEILKNEIQQLKFQLSTYQEKINKENVLISPEKAVFLKAQHGQDKYMYENFFHNLGRPGIFVEFGARNGIAQSNTYFFEKALGWKGLMVEVMEAEYKELVINRPGSLTVNGAICAKPGSIKFAVSQIGGWHGIADDITKERKNQNAKIITVSCYTLNDVIEKSGFRRIDWMSVDTEGSELSVLTAFDFTKVVIDYIQVECLTMEQEKMNGIIQLMESRGYEFFKSYKVADDTRDLMFRRAQISDLRKFKDFKI